MNKKELFRTIKFTLFSISAGLIEIVLYELLAHLTNWSYWPCYLIALVASVIWNFTLNRNYTFKSATNVPIAMTKVFIYYLIFTPLSTIGGNYLAETLKWNGTIVTLLNMIINFITEYLYDRFIVFGNSIDTKEKNDKRKHK
ncbi:MAG: GtrA family protein [Bacilli bacterium]|nr:GtrA family protein [Bacilli bacterium]